MKVEFWDKDIKEALDIAETAIKIYRAQGFKVEYMAVTASATKNYFVSITFK